MTGRSSGIVRRQRPTGRASWTGRLARSPLGVGLVSAGESTFLPLPLESVLMPLMIGYRGKAWTMAAAALLGCVLGSLALYLAGALVLAPVVEPVLGRLGLSQDFADMQARLKGSNLFWTVFVIAISPAPVQLASLGAGAASGNVVWFAAAVAASRGLRYFGLAFAVWLLGARVERITLPTSWLIAGGLAAALLLAAVPMLAGG